MAPLHGERFPNRIFVGIKLSGQRLIDHNEVRLFLCAIAIVEHASAENGDIHRGEVAGQHNQHFRHRLLSMRRSRMIGAPEARPRNDAAERQEMARAGRLHSGHRSHSFEHPHIELGKFLIFGEMAARRELHA
jgi:hypothetical protein